MGHGQQTTMHPDENLLAAFAERTLAPAERGRVLAHLSHCADCRDAVFLAQQAEGEPALQTALLFPEERRWPGALRRRWVSASAAGLVSATLIVGLLLVHRHGDRPGKLPATQMAASRQGASPAQTGIIASTPAASKAALSGKVAAARKPAFRAGSSSIAAKAQAGPPHTGVAASAAALTSPAISSNDSVLPVGAEVAGSVLDPSGAAIPGAKVSLRLGEATTRRATTDPAGHFAISSLAPGSYTVEFIAPGFQTVARDIDVHEQERASLSEILAPGSASQTVSVSGAAATAQPQTENPEVAGAITGKATTGIPLNGRNATQLVPLAPGVLNQTSQDAARMIAPPTTFSIKDGTVRSCVGKVCTAKPLPSRSRAVSLAFDSRTAIVVDASGNLFSTVDAGEHWVAIKTQWQGIATGVKLAPPLSGGVTGGLVAGTQTTSSTFTLTNDQGQVWLSSDEGQTWHLH